jgi:hypothetical protein
MKNNSVSNSRVYQFGDKLVLEGEGMSPTAHPLTILKMKLWNLTKEERRKVWVQTPDSLVSEGRATRLMGLTGSISGSCVA